MSSAENWYPSLPQSSREENAAPELHSGLMDIDDTLYSRDISFDKIHWGSIFGLTEIKKELFETVMIPLQYPEKCRKFKVPSCQGILLHGPPGCGKSLIAQNLGYILKVCCINVPGRDIRHAYHQGKFQELEDLFESAQRRAPCILVLDNIDEIIMKRYSTDNFKDVIMETNFCTAMDDLKSKDPRLTLIGTTSKPLDFFGSGAMSCARIDRKIFVPLPDKDSREKIFNAYLHKNIACECDMEELALKTADYSGAEITKICSTANELRENCPTLTAEELLQRAIHPKHLCGKDSSYTTSEKAAFSLQKFAKVKNEIDALKQNVLHNTKHIQDLEERIRQREIKEEEQSFPKIQDSEAQS